MRQGKTQGPITLAERDIQRAIVDYLRLTGWLVWEFAKPGARPKCPQCGAWVGSVRTAPKGTPDILALKDGRYLWLEVKTPTGKLTEAQAQMALEIEAHGGVGHVVRSLEEAMEVTG